MDEDMNSQKVDQSRTVDLMDTLDPYLISFGFIDQYEKKSSARTYSGFALELEDRWYLCTAAHNIDQVLQILNRGGHFTNWHINDGCLTYKTVPHFAYPFKFMDRPRFCLRDDRSGLDYCLIELENLAVENMKNSGTKAFTANDIGLATEADFWYVTGVPTETIVSDNAHIRQHHFALRARPLPERPKDWEENKSTHAVFGQLEDYPGEEPQIKDIGGMSGGGVFGFYIQADNNVVVKLVGVQVGWSKSKRIVSVAPIAPFIAMVLNEFEQQRTGQSTFPDHDC